MSDTVDKADAAQADLRLQRKREMAEREASYPSISVGCLIVRVMNEGTPGESQQAREFLNAQHHTEDR